MTAFNDLFQVATSKGINVCIASGDNGASDGINDRKYHVDFPSSSPYALACGGTNLKCPALTYSDKNTVESCWGNIRNDGAGGGGFSTVFPSLPYQTNLGITKFAVWPIRRQDGLFILMGVIK